MDVWQGKPRTPVTLNKYLYADSDPVNHVDPSGFMSLGEVGTSLNIQSSLAKLSASAGIRKAFSRFGCELAVNLADQAVTYGIYVLLDASTGGLYVGQAGNIDTRFKQHVAEAVENTNKAWKANAQIIARIPVPGGREALFKVEQLFKDILEQAGHQLLNEREPISRKNQPLRGHYQKFKKVICPKS